MCPLDSRARRWRPGWNGIAFRPQQRARRDAGALVRQLTHPRASRGDRDALRELLTTVIWNGWVDDEDKLRRRLGRVIDPYNEGRVLGPPGATIEPSAS